MNVKTRKQIVMEIFSDQSKATDDGDDIPVIPDIDDIQDDAILQEIKPTK